MSAVIQEVYDQMARFPVCDWVAFSETQHRILSHGEDVESVVAQARERGEDHPLLARVLDPDVMMAF